MTIDHLKFLLHRGTCSICNRFNELGSSPFALYGYGEYGGK